MIHFHNTEIKNIAIHFVGNKNLDEYIQYSNSLVAINEHTDYILANYFLKPFAKKTEQYSFFHNNDLKYNEIYNYVLSIFSNPTELLESSTNIARHLYEQSTHPKIKAGELYIVYFKNCIIDEKTVDAIGIFKSENKDTFLKVFPKGEGFEIESEKGININKLDKGCLIFNIEKEKGYVVAVVDNTNKGVEAQYWIDDFLHVRQRKDEYYNTQNILSLYKSFVKNELPQQFEISKADQADLINKSVQFFKEKETFNLNEFANEVIGNKGVIECFNEYKADYQKERELDIADSFQISASAVKKGTRTLKSVIKLDKNFDIYIHGNSDLIEQGVDEKGKFYKVYYKEEL